MHSLACSPLDVEGLEAGTLVLMHSLDEKIVYGCWQVGLGGWVG